MSYKFLGLFLGGLLIYIQSGYGQFCSGTLGNPIVNITFGSGATNPGPQLSTLVPGASTNYNFASYFQENPPTSIFDGDYALVNKVPFNSAWYTNAKDHTGNVNGYMAFFNAAPTPAEFYRQTVANLCPGTTYEFAVWVANVIDPTILPNGILPNLTFNILNPNTQAIIGTYNTGDIPNVNSMTWKQYSLLFTLPANLNSVTLVLSNNHNGGFVTWGNDLALDDITFRPCGPKTTASFSSSTNLNSLAINTCTSVNLYGKILGGLNNPAYQWQLSTDNGNAFNNITSATTLNYTYPVLNAGNYVFRLISAESANITSSTCRFISDPITLAVNGICPVSCFDSVRFSNTQTQCRIFDFKGSAFPSNKIISQWQWDFGDGSSFGNTQNTTHTYNTNGTKTVKLVVTDVNGCKDSTTSNITISSLLNIDAGKDSTVCENSTFSLHANTVSNFQYAYAWSPKTFLNDSTLQNPSVTIGKNSTKFYVVVKNAAGCSGIDSVTYSPQTPVIKTNKDSSICIGSTVQLNTTGGATYNWTHPETLSNASIAAPQATPTTTTQYIVTGTTSLGCIGKDTVNITVNQLPVVNTTDNTTICQNTSLQLNTTGAISYTWSPTTDLSKSNIANPVANISTATKYVVTGTDINGCIGKDSIQININAKPAITKSKDTSICRNTSLQIFANGGVAYSWLPANSLDRSNINNPIANPSSPTTYYVTVTDANTCVNTDSIKITFKNTPAFNVSPSSTICGKETMQLTASGGDTYLWTPAIGLDANTVNNPIASPTTTTKYSVHIVSNACNDIADLSTTVTVGQSLLITANKSNDIDCLHNAANLSATGGTEYNWTPAEGLNDANIPNPIATPTTTQQYIVKGTNINGCIGYDTIVVNYSFNITNNLYIPNAFSPNGDGLNDCYKIPSSGIITKFQLSIYNRFGEKVFYSEDPADCWDGNYKGKITSGNYVFHLIITSNCGQIDKKGNLILLH